MSVRAHDRIIELFRTLQSRVRKLPKPSPEELSARHAKQAAFRPWILIIAGFCFGLLGYTAVSREAERGWLKDHPPPRLLWEKTLEERGFFPVTDERALFDLQSKLPLGGENVSRVHILGSRRAVFLRIGQDSLLYSHASPKPPSFYREDWEKLGYGWDAYGAFYALELPDPPQAQPKSPHRVRSAPRDPRELHY